MPKRVTRRGNNRKLDGEYVDVPSLENAYTAAFQSIAQSIDIAQDAADVAAAAAASAAGAVAGRADRTLSNLTDAAVAQENLGLLGLIPFVPESFGAVGSESVSAITTSDSVASQNSTAIDSCIAAARLYKGKVLFRKFYAINRSVNLLPGDVIEGTGKGRCGLKALPGSAGYHPIYGDAAHGASLLDFDVYGVAQPSGQYDNIRFENTIRPVTRRIGSYDCDSLCYRFIDCDYPEWEGCSFGSSTEPQFALNASWGCIFDGCLGAKGSFHSGYRCGFGVSIIADDAFRFSDVTFDPATDQVAMPSEAWALAVTGDRVSFRTTGTMPISAGTKYYLIKISDGVVKLAASYANAKSGTAIDITIAGTGLNTMEIENRSSLFTVNTTTDELTLDDQAIYDMLTTGDDVNLGLSINPTPGGTATDLRYYVIKTATNKVVKLATSSANALAGVAIDITSVGSPGYNRLAIGHVNTVSFNDRLSKRPYYRCTGNRVIGGHIDRFKGHSHNINSALDARMSWCVAENSEEYDSPGVLTDRAAFQVKHISGDFCDGSGFDNCSAIRVGTGMMAQQGRNVTLNNFKVEGAEYDGIRSNSCLNMVVNGPYVRHAKGVAFRCYTGGAGFQVYNWNAIAHPAGSAGLLSIAGSSNWIFGAGRHSGVFGYAYSVDASSGFGQILAGNYTNGLPVSIAPDNTRYPVRASLEIDLTVGGSRTLMGASSTIGGLQIMRFTLHTITAVTGAPNVRLGRTSSSTAYRATSAPNAAVSGLAYFAPANADGSDFKANSGWFITAEVSTVATAGRCLIEVAGVPQLG